MKLQQYLLTYYLHIPFEDFSHRAVAALGILKSIERNTNSEMRKEDRERITKAIEKIRHICEVTDDKTNISLFVLDRNVTPQDLVKNPANIYITFTRAPRFGGTTLKLNADQIQDLLCNAMIEINDIVMASVAPYSEQIMVTDDF